MTDISLIFFLLLLFCWDLPPHHPATLLIRPLAPAIRFLGLWHSWAMFAPNPIAVNQRLYAILLFSDGRQQRWLPMQAASENWWNRLLYARSWKFEHALLLESPALRESLCRFLARRVEQYASPLTQITLYREYQDIQPWSAADVYGPTRTETLLTWPRQLPQQSAEGDRE